MARLGGPTPPSPSGTVFSNASGLSAYRDRDPYRPMAVPPVPQTSSQLTFRRYYEQMQAFLASEDIRENPGARTDPRSKLIRLNETQFLELSTDVNDECMRRNSPNPTPFLPVRTELHPKRNQARQKLATLSKAKFRDLASDIFFELSRRFPQFKEGQEGERPNSDYEDEKASPPPMYNPMNGNTPNYGFSGRPQQQQQQAVQEGYITTPPPDRLENPFGPPSNPPSRIDLRRPSMEEQDSSSSRRRPSEQESISSRRRPSDEQSTQSRGRPSLDDKRPSFDQQTGPIWRRPSDRDRRMAPTEPLQISSNRPSQESQFSPPPTSTATSGMVIPNKSTIAEEEIEVPYGRDDSQDDRPSSLASIASTEEQKSPPTASLPPIGGLSALGTSFDKRLLLSPGSDDDDADLSATSRGVSEFYDKMSYGRASVASGTSAVGKTNSRFVDRESIERDATEKLRREYEFKVATMQNRITALEAELADAFKTRDANEDKTRDIQQDLEQANMRSDEQASSLRELELELEETRALLGLEKEQAGKRMQEDEEEIMKLRERCGRLEAEASAKPPDTTAVVDQMRTEIQNLVNELNELSERNEEMMAEKDADAYIIRDLNAQIKEWKRKYESAKTELRHIKATSQLSSLATPQTPKGDDHMPVSDQGAIADIHITAFQSSIDSLLSAGRSNAPTSVLTAMKTVVQAVSNITDDVRTFELRARKDKFGVDEELVRSLKDRASATLNNLVMASKNHGTSYGLSPVSLLDAAASHVSSTVVEIVKVLKIRKTNKSYMDRAGSLNGPTKGYSPALRSVVEQGTPDRSPRSASAASGSRDPGSGPDRNSGPSPIRTASRRKSNISGEGRGIPTPDRSSPTNSPQPYGVEATGSRRMPAQAREDVVPTEGSDDAWEELKPYLEAQSESIVYSIQSVLTAIRGGAQSAELNENLTSIITIVSSIVAVCKDSLPTGSARQGQELLRELSEHCNTLSEAQVSGEINKQMRQAMATASFGVAKALKELMKL